MRNNKKLTIVYACDDNVFDGLFLSILSIVKRTKNPISFIIFTANLKEIKKSYTSVSEIHVGIIKKMIKKYNKNNTLTVLDCKENFYLRTNNTIPPTKGWTPYTTFRLLFDMFNQLNGVILYMDTDTLVCDDISKAFDVDMKKYEMCVTKDIFDRGDSFKKNYFNAGIILFNMDKLRKTNCLAEAFKYLLHKSPKFCDQDALNKMGSYILYRDDDRYNRIWRQRLDTTVIKHFAGNCPKPWEKKFERKYDKFNYRVWQEDIQEWKEMKSNL